MSTCSAEVPLSKMSNCSGALTPDLPVGEEGKQKDGIYLLTMEMIINYGKFKVPMIL